VALKPEFGLVFVCELIECEEADVVAGEFVLWAGVTKSGDKKLHWAVLNWFAAQVT
jgi:hypothetical protein